MDGWMDGWMRKLVNLDGSSKEAALDRHNKMSSGLRQLFLAGFGSCLGVS